MKYFIIGFICTCLLSAFIAWCSGFNFDYRSVGVALWSFYTIIMALLTGLACFDIFGRRE